MALQAAVVCNLPHLTPPSKIHHFPPVILGVHVVYLRFHQTTKFVASLDLKKQPPKGCLGVSNSTTNKVVAPRQKTLKHLQRKQESKSFHTILQQNKRIALAKIAASATLQHVLHDMLFFFSGFFQQFKDLKNSTTARSFSEKQANPNVCLEYPWVSISQNQAFSCGISLTFETPQVMKRLVPIEIYSKAVDPTMVS